MSHPHNTDEAVTEQHLRPHLRTRWPSDDACFQVDAAVAQRRAVLIRFRPLSAAALGRTPFVLAQARTVSPVEHHLPRQTVGRGQFVGEAGYAGAVERQVDDLAETDPALVVDDVQDPEWTRPRTRLHWGRR